MTTETIKPADAARQLHSYMQGEGLDSLQKEEVSEFLDNLGIAPRSRGMVVGYGSRSPQKWWTSNKSTGELKLLSNRNGAAPDQGQGELPALESSEADLRDMAVRLGIAPDRSAATAFHLAATRDLGNPKAFALGLANCPLNLNERVRLYSTWFSAAGIEAPAYADVGTADDPTGRASKRKQAFLAVNGEVMRLDDPDDDAGLSWGQAFQLATLQVEKLKLERSSDSGENPLDRWFPGLTSRITELLLKPAPTLPDGTNLETFKYIRESQFKDQALAMAKDALPELIKMGKDAAQATRELARQRGHSPPPTPQPETDAQSMTPVTCRTCLQEQLTTAGVLFQCAQCGQACNPDGSLYSPPQPEAHQDGQDIDPRVTIRRHSQPPEDDLISEPEMTQPIPVDLEDGVPVVPATNT